MAAPQSQQQPLRFVKADCDNQLMPENPVMNELLSNMEPAKFCLKVFSKERELQKEIPLKKHAPIYVGRAIGCQIDLVDISISRRHCVFQYKDLLMEPGTRPALTGFCIYDLKSTHGTFLNGEKVPSMQNIQLRPGDVVRFGLHECDFEFHEIENADAANATADGTTEQQAVNEHVEPPTVSHPEKHVNGIQIISEEIEHINSLPEEERHKKAETLKEELKEMIRRLYPDGGEMEVTHANIAGSNEDALEPKSGKRGRRGKKKNEDTLPPPPVKRGRPKKSLDKAYGQQMNGRHTEEEQIPAKRGRKPKRNTTVVAIEHLSQNITQTDFELDPDLLGAASTISEQTDPLDVAAPAGKQKRQRKQPQNAKQEQKPTKARGRPPKAAAAKNENVEVKKRKQRSREIDMLLDNSPPQTFNENQPLSSTSNGGRQTKKGRPKKAANSQTNKAHNYPPTVNGTTTAGKKRGRKSQKTQQSDDKISNEAPPKRGRKRKVDANEYDEDDSLPLSKRLELHTPPKGKPKQRFDIVKIDSSEQGRIATSPHPKICIPRLSMDVKTLHATENEILPPNETEDPVTEEDKTEE